MADSVTGRRKGDAGVREEAATSLEGLVGLDRMYGFYYKLNVKLVEGFKISFWPLRNRLSMRGGKEVSGGAATRVPLRER